MKLVQYLCLFLLCVTGVSAQSFYGSLRGRVMDQSGSVIPGATVTVVDRSTSFQRSTVSSASGEFAFASLNPATYSVVVESPGFKILERENVTISTQSAVTVDLQLEIGEVTEQVFVTEEIPLLETANASTGTVIDRQKLGDLPNLGRNPFMMSKLSEAIVQTGNPKFNRMQDQSGSSQISIAGGPVRGNNYTLDGVAITDSSNRAVIIPSIEAVEEVKVQANTYDAEMGRTGGGTFNTTLRSGTNKLNFSAFGYIRETPWLANNFFSNRAGQEIIDQPFRNYGGSIGGPIIIPKVYDGRNKTFFWISGEAYRQTESAGTRLSVPTALERLGDFSQSLAPSGAASQVIYDPLTTTSGGVRTPFANNIIPGTRINGVGSAMASYYPLPNVQAGFYGDPNFDVSVPAFNRADQTTWKLDQEITSWLKMNMSYLHYGSQEPSNLWFGSVASPNQSVLFRQVDTTQVNAILTPTPTMVVAIRYGFNRFPNFSKPNSLGFDLSLLNLPSSYTSLVDIPAFPSITVGDLQNFGGSASISQSVLHSRSWNGTVSKFMGKHSLKFGVDYRKLNNDRQPTGGPGSFSFTDVFTRSNPSSAVVGTGSGLATMLLGYPTDGSMTRGESFFNYIKYYGLFVQDDWRLTPKLTLNFGLRYEYETAPQESENNFIIGFDPTAPSPLQASVSDPLAFGTLLYAGVDGNGTQSGDPRNKLGPRFGLAYSVNDKTVVRGGWGIFWAPQNFSAQQALGYSQETPIVTSFDNNFTPAASLSNPYPNGLLPIEGNAARGSAGIGRDISIPDLTARSGGYVHQYSFDIQRELKAGFAVSVGYIGSTSRQLHLNQDINQVHPDYFSLGASGLNAKVANPFYNNGGVLNIGSPTIARSQLLKPFPQFIRVTLEDSDIGSAQYHSAYIKVQRRFAQGLTSQVTYNWSQKEELSVGTGWQNIYDTTNEYGLSAQHSPHRLSIAATYELPVGKGKAYLSNNAILDALIGGWSFNVVSVLQTGYPLGITQSNTNSVAAARAQRPNATGSSPVIDTPLTDRLDNYLSRDAFSAAPQFTFGNLAPRISLRGPASYNWDASIFKTFTMGERFKAQLRGEALNLTNTPLFADPATNISNGNFGAITSQRNFSRLIQIGVRFFM